MAQQLDPATYTTSGLLTAPTAWESIPKFIRFMVWVWAVLAFLSVLGGGVFLAFVLPVIGGASL